MITLLLVQVVVETPAPPMPFPLPWYETLPAPVVVLISLAALGALVVITWPLVRAIARRIEGKGGADPALLEEVEQLRQRVSDLEAVQGRMAELEERVDFAERLLARQRAPERLPGEAQP